VGPYKTGSHLHVESTIFFWFSRKSKVFPKYGEDREILKMAQKHGNSAAAHARKVLPFSVTNELGLENHLSYPCVKLGENRLKWWGGG